MKLSLVIAVAGVVLASISAAVADTGGVPRDAQIKFPYLLKIPPGSMLVVHGRQMPDSVTITWEPGDTVRIDGIPVYPGPRVPPREFSDEEVARAYKNVPFVADRVRAGATWDDASREYDRRADALCRKVRKTYWAVKDSTGSHDLAAEAALKSIDRSLLKPGVEPRASDSGIVVDWEGMPSEVISFGEHAPEAKPRKPRTITQDEAWWYAHFVVEHLEAGWRDARFVFLSPASSHSLNGSEAVEAMRQVEEAKQGIPSKGPLGDAEIEEVRKAYGDK